jgi:ubiquinone/menaquinone biosynthesis C-methylase UbiE
VENVRDFWNKEAKEWGDDPRVTIRDHYFRLLEIETVCNLIRGGHQALDIGCGSGFSSIYYAEVLDDLLAVDYAELMVDRARRFLHDPSYYNETMTRYAGNGRPVLRGNLRFEHGNLLAIDVPSGALDTVIAERVLINLPTQDLQDRAVGEVARVLCPGGLWTLVEVSNQGHQSVDSIRETFGLPRIEKYWHNLYIDEPHFNTVLQFSGFSIRKIHRFETYQFLTKVVHPVVVAPEEPQFLAGFNKAAWLVSRQFPAYEDVNRIGLERFLKKILRPILVEHDSAKADGYDQVIPRVLSANPNFTGCSHQVLFVLDRMATS